MDADSENKLASVDPELAALVLEMSDELEAQGIPIRVNSALRSTAQQQKLYDNRANNPYPVAVPGTSKHELGLAVDVVPVGARSSAIWETIGQTGESLGLRWGGRFSKPDYPHFELQASSGGSADDAWSVDATDDAGADSASFLSDYTPLEIGLVLGAIGLAVVWLSQEG